MSIYLFSSTYSPNTLLTNINYRKMHKMDRIYLTVRRSIYGLPRAGALTNKQLKKFLAPDGYYEVAHIPWLWRHSTRPIQFSLVVDDFGVKYVGKKYVEHLVHCLNGPRGMS